MQTLFTSKPAAMQAARPSLDDAWFAASIEVDNGTAIAELAWRSLVDGALSLDTINEQRALDGAITILKKVSDFFDRYQLELRDLTSKQANPEPDRHMPPADSRDEMQVLSRAAAATRQG